MTATPEIPVPAGRAEATVYYDAQCPLCARWARRTAALDRAGRLGWLDANVHRADLPAAIRCAGFGGQGAASAGGVKARARAPGDASDDGGPAACDSPRAIAVRLPGGEFRSGIAALAEIWARLPTRRHRLLARLARLPVLRRLFEPLYAAIARHRTSLSRWLGWG